MLKAHKPLVVCGQHGVGKSEAVRRAVEKAGYVRTEWFVASNLVFLQRDLWHKLHISIDRENIREKLGDSIRENIEKKDTALIFENVTDAYVLKQLSHIQIEAQIIITTPLNPSVGISGDESILLQRWEADLCAEFLKNYFSYQVSIELKQSCLPSALKMAVALMRETGESWGKIWEKLKRIETEECVFQLYTLLEQRKKENVAAAEWALELLKFSALLCGDFISFEMLQKLTGYTLKRVKEGVRYLEQLALLQIKDQYITIDADVQKVVQNCMDENQIDSCSQVFIKLIDEAFHEIHIKTWKLQEGCEWRAHLEAAITAGFGMCGNQEKLQKLRLLAGKYDFVSGEYDSARQFFEEIKESALQEEQKEVRRDAMLELARVLEAENDNGGVRRELEQIDREWSLLAQENPEIRIEALIIASQAEENKGNYKRAESLLTEGLHLLEESPDLPEELRAEKRICLLNGIGKIYYIRRRFRKAIHIYNKALGLCESMNDPQAAFLLGNKGAALYSLGEYKGAEDCFLRQKDIYGSVGQYKLSCDAVRNINVLIVLYTNMKEKGDRVDQYWEKGKRICEERGEKEYRTIELYLYNSYGVYLYQKGNICGALEIFEQGLRLCEHGDREDNYKIQTALLQNRAQTFYKRGNYISALDDLKLILKRYKGRKREYLYILLQYAAVYGKYMLFDRK